MNEEISVNRQIFKFKMYGFLKNLRFYDPIFFIFLLENNTFLEIGLLFSIREAIVYIFEVPSGVIADMYGKKLELAMCFVFYILSFGFFFIGGEYYIFVIAMILFGFGEAFRSGTHKAMIMSYIEHKELKQTKSEIYGSTRAFSMLGSAMSSLVFIGLLIVLPELKWFFIIVMIPYVLDLLLILSYPNFLNEKQDVSFNFKDFLKQNYLSVVYVFKDKELVKVLLSSSFYNGVFKSIKDYIQPILLISSAGLFLSYEFESIDNTFLSLGIIYAVIYFISAIASKQSSRVGNKLGLDKTLDLAWLGFGVSTILVSIFIDNGIVVGVGFIMMYIVTNVRRPLMVGKVGDKIISTKRASVLSIESQFTSLVVIVLAPILGLIVDNYSIKTLMQSMSIILIGLYVIIAVQRLVSSKFKSSSC
ncbi:MAG: MFS transporter [Candidatus Izemoplasma sp.]